MSLEIDHQVALPPVDVDGESSQGEVDRGGVGVGRRWRTNPIFRNFPSGKIGNLKNLTKINI